MHDYISRDAVFDWFCESADIDGCVDLPKNNGSCKKGCRHCIDGKELDEIPPADVRENVHGKWIAVKIGNGDTRYTCSECGVSYECDSREAWDFIFCPKCGMETERTLWNSLQ